MPIAWVLGSDAEGVARIGRVLSEAGFELAAPTALEGPSAVQGDPAGLLVLCGDEDLEARVRRCRSASGLARRPLLAVCATAGSAAQALAAGADDWIAEPFAPGELALRAHHLAGRGSDRDRPRHGELAREPERRNDLAGNLAVCGLRETMQLLGTLAGSGTLTFRQGTREAAVRIRRGAIVAVSYGVLHGEEALLAMVERFDDGTFSFTVDETVDDRDAGVQIASIQTALVYAAWLEDELALRRHLLPPEDQPLRLVKRLALPDESDVRAIPLRDVQSWVELFPGITLRDLLRRNFAAAVRVRLAVCWLIEKEALVAGGGGASPFAGPRAAPTSAGGRSVGS